MLDSKIIEIDGVFLGTAIQVKGHGGRRFYAAHESVRVLHNAVKPDLAVMARVVASQFRKSRVERLAA
ncbi:hypothetical protein FOH24_02685 [Acetobacter tropicalis]|uniref:Uncharacterized protein n=1 Tax=Acetobacter tropicalis TaxID=104102 RepID=A0A094Z1B1_9PROT|nr:hypothetical protein [Acetobacter tropicalis]KAA8391002.1 hypothetical protein FOH22_01270 [Acetobacter tropicalis]KAA8392564.1 hypothetical protein FOH24_02685 [Acetobacter tropicalis]KGB26719.1 hypothetical protein AtDm6_0083 [Acetobacter tropicalis]KXV56368.1 hypothetical protein AD947_11370 [Acetobacter tropicalis]MBC9009160.1 hypothetical protein [Acetobacter tropicalis]